MRVMRPFPPHLGFPYRGAYFLFSSCLISFFGFPKQYGGIFRRPSDLAGRPPELVPTGGRRLAAGGSGAFRSWLRPGRRPEPS